MKSLYYAILGHTMLSLIQETKFPTSTLSILHRRKIFKFQLGVLQYDKEGSNYQDFKWSYYLITT